MNEFYMIVRQYMKKYEEDNFETKYIEMEEILGVVETKKKARNIIKKNGWKRKVVKTQGYETMTEVITVREVTERDVEYDNGRWTIR